MFNGIISINGTFSEKQLASMVEIYQEGFRGAPWFETWEFSDALIHLTKLLESGTLVLACSHDQEILGFGIGISLSTYEGKNELLRYGSKENDVYVTELVVSSKAQRQGIALNIMHTFASHAHTSSKGLLFRTHVENVAMIRVAKGLEMKHIAKYTAITGGQESTRVVYRKKCKIE